MNLFDDINNKYNTEFTNRLVKNKHIFMEIYSKCNNTFINGCGSYLFDGQKYEYCDKMYKKQELLYNSVKNTNSILEIGTYMGHSLLIMLLSNPNLKITCIDISNKYTGPAVEILNKYFNNAITFICGNSLDVLLTLNTKFDLFHIDGNHDENFIYKEFTLIHQLSNDSNILKVLFDDENCLRRLQEYIRVNFMVLKENCPKCEWSNIYFELLIKPCDINTSTKLCEIMNNNNTDKGSLLLDKYGHNYTPLYYYLFQNIQLNPLRIFELGIGSNDTSIESNMGEDGVVGASLYGWSEFFINSKIYGADIDKKTLFNIDRIKTFYCDQTKSTIIKSMWDEPELKEGFDIIIDDGLHSFDGSVCFFENSIHKLKPDGFYIIEDINRTQIPLYNEILNKWRSQYPNYTFTLITIPSNKNLWDNTLLLIH
jgi:SAM-dependent methyltransferase